MTIQEFSSIHLTRPLVIGTRGSALAMWQSQHVKAALLKHAPELSVEIQIIKTQGDRDQTRSLAEFGGLGVFTKEIENALLAHEIDIAVHSLKDLPTELSAGLMIGAVPDREDARDCIVSRHGVGLARLPHGARIGTSSARRTAQILALRPDAQVVPLRGNVDTRLRKAQTEEYDAVVLAAAGITRLGRASEITDYLPFEAVLPDPGQGALGIEIRADDTTLAQLLASLNHAPTRAAVTAERAFLQALGGGCRMPIGAYAEMVGEQLRLRGVVGSVDGHTMVSGEIAGDPAQAEALGTSLAEQLVRSGAGEILGIPSATAGPSHLEAMGEAPGPSPLQGKRIVITRALDQASALADEIRAQGGEPIEFPTIEIAPLEDFHALDAALARSGEYDWVVFTSANGVRAIAQRLRALGRKMHIFDGRKIAAIGPATAQALEAQGLHVDFIPTRFLGEQIAVELPVEPGQRALLLRADIASDVLATGLTARGVQVTNVDAYRTVKPRVRMANLDRADAITFTSSSTVRNFIAMLGGERHDLISHLTVFCIGPVTAKTAAELGLRVDAVASEHTVQGLVETMKEYYSKQ